MKFPGGQKLKPITRFPTTSEFTINIGVQRDAPFDVVFAVGDLFTTMDPDQAEVIARQFMNVAKASRLARAQRVESTARPLILPG